MKVHVNRMNGEEFDVDVIDGMTVLETKRQIKKLKAYSEPAGALQLVLGSDVLSNSSTLTECVKDGETLTLVKRRGCPLMELIVDINDNTQWHGKHKFALLSKPLGGEVEKIEVSVADFQDQGWGGCQARLFIYLYDEEDKVVASKLIFGPLRTAAYDEAKYGRSPSCTLSAEEEVVGMAREGMVYRLKYQCGGGGGHSITVKNWCCKVVPKIVNEDEQTVKVISKVNLRNQSRLGPDRDTGLWELKEPIQPGDICGDFKDDDDNDYSFTLDENCDLVFTSCKRIMTGDARSCLGALLPGWMGTSCASSSLPQPQKKVMKGVLASNGEFLEGETVCDGVELKVRLKATAANEIAFEWQEADATAWSKEILHRHIEGLINPSEEARTYSSIYGDEQKGTGHARSMLNSPQGWSAKRNAEGEWMQIDLEEEKSIRGVVVQGRSDTYSQAVTEFSVSHSIDGVSFEEIKQTFQYDRRAFGVSQAIVFECGSVKARYIKLTVQRWNSHVSMRAAVMEGAAGEVEAHGESEKSNNSSGYE